MKNSTFDINIVNKWDRDAFLMLYNNYYKALVAYAFSIVNDIDDAEDVVQECFSKLVGRKVKFQSRSKLEAFLYIIVRNRSISFLKTKSRENAVFVPISDDNVTLMDEEELFSEAVYARLFYSIDRLPKREREVLLLVVEGKKNQEIAEILGMQTETVRTHKKRAKATLTKLLSPSNDDVITILTLLAIHSLCMR